MGQVGVPETTGKRRNDMPPEHEGRGRGLGGKQVHGRGGCGCPRVHDGINCGVMGQQDVTRKWGDGTLASGRLDYDRLPWRKVGHKAGLRSSKMRAQTAGGGTVGRQCFMCSCEKLAEPGETVEIWDTCQRLRTKLTSLARRHQKYSIKCT